MTNPQTGKGSGCAILILGVSLLLVLCGNAFAYRPFITDGAEPVGKEVFVDELGWDKLTWKNKDTDNIFSSFMFYGITKDLHVAIGVPYIIHNIKNGDKTDGFGDLYYFAKYAFLRNSKDQALASVKLQYKDGNGNYDKYTGFGDKEYQGSLCLTKVFGDDIQIHGQFGYNWISAEKNPNYHNYFNYGIAADYLVTAKFHLLFEVSGNENLDRTLENQRVGMFGANYTINEHYVIDASYRKGLTDTTQDNQIGIGLTLIF
jgi:hypothetical protein